jgi:pimeloyl-ACP methyl ester carboxylesterase
MARAILSLLAIATLAGIVLYLLDMRGAYRRIAGRSQIVTTEYGDIEYARGGSGLSVLVVHGSGGGFDQGALIAEAVLGEGFAWIAPSRFGYLRSALPPGATFDDQAHAYDRLIDRLGLQRVAVVALSHGGPSALMFAALHPERVSALVLLSCGVASSTEPGQGEANRKGDALTTIFSRDAFYWAASCFLRGRLTELMGASPAIVEALPPSLRELVRRVIDEMNPVSPRYPRVVFDNRAAMPNERIAAIRAPALILHAADDSLQLYRNAEFAAARIPGARLWRFERGGHLLIAVEQPVVREDPTMRPLAVLAHGHVRRAQGLRAVRLQGIQTVRYSRLACLFPLLLAAACTGTQRPTPPVKGEPVVLPWGAVSLQRGAATEGNDQRDAMVTALRARIAAKLAASDQGTVEYRVLAISVGGSRGAYGAGLLAGWSARGDRPEFDVVTGISTGALMATHAFLGSEFDEGLQLYRRTKNEDVFRKRGKLAAFNDDALLDTAPLRATLSALLTEQVVRRVAEEHAKGRRLYIGTTNPDANIFTAWDMGAIASSDRPDRLERYRDVVRASAAFPIAFPPVYFEVDRPDGKRFAQMHADGGLRQTVFFYHEDEWLEALRVEGVRPERMRPMLYLLNNDRIHARARYNPVDGCTLSTAGASIDTLMRQTLFNSLYRLWVTTKSNGADFNIAYIPREFDLSDNSLLFDNVEMEKLYQLGYQGARSGTAWFTQKAPTTLEELARVIDPRDTMDRLESGKSPRAR